MTSLPLATLSRPIPETRAVPALAGLRSALACAALALLAACGGSGVTGGVSSTSRSGQVVRTPPATSVRPAAPTGARDPRLLNLPGLEGVIGVSAKDLVRQFGQPRLDVWEGDAHKLQFTGKACLLDIYLYPTSSSREPVATYLDARRHSDGKDVDRASCVAALRQR